MIELIERFDNPEFKSVTSETDYLTADELLDKIDDLKKKLKKARKEKKRWKRKYLELKCQIAINE